MNDAEDTEPLDAADHDTPTDDINILRESLEVPQQEFSATAQTFTVGLDPREYEYS